METTKPSDADEPYEPLLWAEALSSNTVRDLIGYAQRYDIQQEWMNAQELAHKAGVSGRTTDDHLDTAVMFGAYETTVENGQRLYRPVDDAYVLAVLRDIEATIRYNLSEEEDSQKTTDVMTALD